MNTKHSKSTNLQQGTDPTEGTQGRVARPERRLGCHRSTPNQLKTIYSNNM